MFYIYWFLNQLQNVLINRIHFHIFAEGLYPGELIVECIFFVVWQVDGLITGGGEGAYEQKLTVFHWMAIRTVYISIDPVRNNEALEEYTYNLFYKGRLPRWRLEIGGLKLGEHYSMYLSSGFNVAEDLVHSPCFWKHPTNSQTVPNGQEIASNLKTKQYTLLEHC